MFLLLLPVAAATSAPACAQRQGLSKLPLTNFQASRGQSAPMLKHLAIFLCYAGGAAALAFYGPQWLPVGSPLAGPPAALGLGAAVLLGASGRASRREREWRD